MTNELVWLAAAVIAAASLTFGGIMLYQRNKMKKLIAFMKEERNKREYEIEMEQHKAEIVSLQSQINPHFLYNTLEVIRSEAVMNRDMESAQMAEALANYFRYNISKKKDIVTVGEELDNIDNYISIQKHRFGDRITYQTVYHSDEEEIRRALMPKLVLQPLVENSIFHGLEKKAKGGTVTIHLTATEKRLILQVEDDGQGMDRETLQQVERMLSGLTEKNAGTEAGRSRHGGIALANINRRIQMLYGKDYGLSFSSTNNVGTEAELTLPYYVDDARHRP